MSAEKPDQPLRVIVTGTGGRLGAAVARRLRQAHHVLSYDRRAMDLMSEPAIIDHLTAVKFDAIIHCAALTSLDYCEQNPNEAYAVNTTAPALMARLCSEASARMIYISTDYVYDGTTPEVKSEDSSLAPLSVYSKTKRAGEEAVLKSDPSFLVARTSWVFGPDRESFIDQTIQRAGTQASGNAIADKYSAPTYSLDAADQLALLLALPHCGGVINLCNDGACSWHELGEAALAIVAELGWKLNYHTLTPLGLADMEKFIAPRPIHTVMSIHRLGEITGLRPRHWTESLRSYLETYYGPGAHGKQL